MSKYKRTFQLLFLAFLIIGSIYIIRQQHVEQYRNDSGFIFGTEYHVTYQSADDLHGVILSTLNGVDNSLSTFNKASVISKVNRGESVRLDSNFCYVFSLAQKVSEDTNGAFDITVAPLVNAWGFGFSNKVEPTPDAIDSLLKLVGYKNVSLENGRIMKKNSRTMLDCSAIAKGYGVDAVAKSLSSHGVKNYMVEIGGEVVTRGLSEKRIPWKIGVVKPTENPDNAAHELQTVINVTDKAMATSGNYRNFYYKNGRKYAHTIDPRTGRPVQHTILSSTVIAPDCATADAYATAFMVMGLEDAKKVLKRHTELWAYLICSDNSGKNVVWKSSESAEGIITE